MEVMTSGSCEAAREEPDAGEEEPRSGAGDGPLEVLGKAAAAAEPGEGALDHPSLRQELKAFDAGWALDDLDGPGTAVSDGIAQLWTAIDAIRENVSKSRKLAAKRVQ